MESLIKTRTKFSHRVRVIQVVLVPVQMGKGTDDDPIRDGIEFWDMDGNLLFRTDATIVCDERLVPTKKLFG